MQDTILKICKQIHDMLPTKRIAITRFVGNYEYGQIYVGELDREVKREPCGYMFAKRNFCIVYSQDPSKPQEEKRQDFENVCRTLEDNAPFVYEPRWYSTFFDVYETSLIFEFKVYERYERVANPNPYAEMGSLELIYPKVIYEGDSPEPGPEPPEPPEPSIPDFDGQGITGTMRLWGSLPSTGTEFIGLGTVSDGKLLSGSEQLTGEVEWQIGGIMTVPE